MRLEVTLDPSRTEPMPDGKPATAGTSFAVIPSLIAAGFPAKPSGLQVRAAAVADQEGHAYEGGLSHRLDDTATAARIVTAGAEGE